MDRGECILAEEPSAGERAFLNTSQFKRVRSWPASAAVARCLNFMGFPRETAKTPALIAARHSLTPLSHVPTLSREIGPD